MAQPVTKLIVDGVATITLNQPDAHNVLNEAMTKMLLDTLCELDSNQSVRVVVLTANGDSFCAGVDLKWMTAPPTGQQQNNNLVGQQLATLMSTLYHLSKPTIVLINGAVYGGGIGLVACCDIALASRNAHFCFSEVRLGLIPAVISPYIVNAIGARAARRYLLTAEHISAKRAFDIGLVHEVLTDDQLQSYVSKLCQHLIAAGPRALARTKQLINDIAHSQLDTNLKKKTATWLAEVGDSAEAREGISAFLEKRPAKWVNSNRE